MKNSPNPTGGPPLLNFSEVCLLLQVVFQKLMINYSLMEDNNYSVKMADIGRHVILLVLKLRGMAILCVHRDLGCGTEAPPECVMETDQLPL